MDVNWFTGLARDAVQRAIDSHRESKGGVVASLQPERDHEISSIGILASPPARTGRPQTAPIDRGCLTAVRFDA